MKHDVAAIASGLTDARKRLILELPDDQSWGAVSSRSVAKRLWWGHMPNLIDHKHCPSDKNEWRLTAVGVEVRRHFATHPHGDASGGEG